MLDRHTLETIFREHHAQCLVFAVHYTGNEHDAEEVIQQVFLRLWEKRNTIEIAGVVRSYLFAAIRNTAISNWRKENVRQKKEDIAGTFRLTDPVVQSPVCGSWNVYIRKRWKYYRNVAVKYLYSVGRSS
jgi:RNA polymerase sigma-70 factor (ECF subfamily)